MTSVSYERVARPMARGLAALSGGRIVALALQFVAFAVIAGSLGPGDFGVYSFAIGFFGLFRFITNFGFRAVVQRDVAQHPEREPELVPNLVYLRIVLGLVAYGLLAVGLVAAGYDSGERHAALVVGILLSLLALESFQVGLEVRLRMGWVSASDVAEGVVLASGAIALGLAGAGPVAFLWLFVVAHAAKLAVVSVVGVSVTSLDWRPRPDLWGSTLRAAAWLGLAQLFIVLYYRLDLLVLARLKPAAAVGQYGAGYQFLETLVVVPSLALTVLAPVLAGSYAEGHDVLQRRYERVMHLVALAAFPVAVGGALTAWRAVPALPGFGDFGGAGVSLAILAPAAACIFFGAVLSSLLVAGHLQRRLTAVSAACLLANIVLILVLIPPFSYKGAAVATTVTELLVVFGSIRIARRRLGVRWGPGSIARASRASLVMALALVVTYPLPALVQVGIGAAVYLLALLPTRSLTWGDLGGLMSIDGPPALVAPAGDRHDVDDGTLVVPHGSLLATRRALRGARSCEVRAARSGDVRWVPLAARLAGCQRVTCTLDAGERPLLTAMLWGLLVDEVTP